MIDWNKISSDPAATTAPFTGLRVLDFSELVPGPLLTQSLSEMGADVLKIERPPHGDNLRLMSPALFNALNQNKRCVRLNLKDEQERAQVLALLDQADVLVENYRPGVMERLGLGPIAMLKRNPRLIYASISGYGANGPWAQRSGHDMNYLATAGIVALSKSPLNQSPFMGVPYADLGGSIYALAAVNAALFQRERTHHGQHLDISMTDCVAHWSNIRTPVLRSMETNGTKSSIEQIQKRPGYGVFHCNDQRCITIAALEDHFWLALVQALCLKDFAGESFKNHRHRVEHAEAINAAIQQAVSLHTAQSALALLDAADVPTSLVEHPLSLHEHVQFKARGLFKDSLSGPLARFPVRLTGM